MMMIISQVMYISFCYGSIMGGKLENRTELRFSYKNVFMIVNSDDGDDIISYNDES